MKYEILASYNREELVKLVNLCLQDGWRLHGDLIIVKIDSHGSFAVELNYFQAVTKGDGGQE